MPIRSAESRVFNLSFGGVLQKPITFSWRSEYLSQQYGRNINFNGELFNSLPYYDAEKQLADFHSFSNKQNLGHNYRAPAQTGVLRISYDDFAPTETYAHTEDVNFFLNDYVAPIFSFFQRRRILFGTVRLTSSQQLIIAMPTLAAGEWIDSIAFGPATIDYSDLQTGVSLSIAKLQQVTAEQKSRIRMLLKRYNEVLNLPYIHERVEGLWRIVEALGGVHTATQLAQNEYARFKQLLNIRNQAPNLEALLIALHHYKIPYSDDEVVESRKFRNHSTHQYLDHALTTWPNISMIFQFLGKCVDNAIASELGLLNIRLLPHTFSIIENRVL